MAAAVYGAIGPRGEERALAYRLLGIALEREYGLDTTPEILRAEGGKPYFPSFPHIQFNLSHSRGAAVCAVSGKPVGIDVELLRAAPKRLAAGMDNDSFFRLWTAKEATVKYRGQGIGALLGPLEPDRRCQCLEGFLPGCIVTVCPGLGRTARARFTAEINGVCRPVTVLRFFEEP